MIENILEKFENIQKLPSYEELENTLCIDIFDENILTKVEFELTKMLSEKCSFTANEHWDRLKRRWKARWC